MNRDGHFLRQSSVVPRDEARRLTATVIGAGATGSWTTLQLAKLGVERITVIDHDVVNIPNLGPQLYSSADENRPKVEALAAFLDLHEGVQIEAMRARVGDDETPPLGEVVFACVDSMAARKTIWDLVKCSRGTHLVIDPRMAADTCMIEVGVPPHDKRYEETLYPDEEAYQAPCGARSTAFAAGACACLSMGLLARYLRKEPLPRSLQLDLRTFMLQNPDVGRIITRRDLMTEFELAA